MVECSPGQMGPGLRVPRSWGWQGATGGIWDPCGDHSGGGKQEPKRGFKALMKPLIKIRSDSAPLQGEACLGK